MAGECNNLGSDGCGNQRTNMAVSKPAMPAQAGKAGAPPVET
jgi:hypothetical protein